MTATVRVEPDVCLPSPHRHASGHGLPGQWAIPFVMWKKPVIRLAAAKGLKQLQRVGADADGAGLAALAQEQDIAAFLQRFDVLPPQPAQLGHTAALQIGTADHDVVPRCHGGAFYPRGTDAPRTDVRSDSASGLASFGADIPVLRGIGLRGTPVTAARVGSVAHR